MPQGGLTTGGFAAWRLCAPTPSAAVDFLLAKTQRRKGIERSLTNLSLLGSCLPEAGILLTCTSSFFNIEFQTPIEE
jgi:hypothetical protein